MTLDMVRVPAHRCRQSDALHPKQWLPKEMMPPMDSIEQMNHNLGLIMRHFNGEIEALAAEVQA